MVCIDLLRSEMNKFRSSVNKAILSSVGPTVIPLSWGGEHISIANGSIANVINKGERGQP